MLDCIGISGIDLAAPVLAHRGGCFLSLSFLANVIIAHIIITKVNKSSYVIMFTILFPRFKVNGKAALSAARVNILYCQCSVLGDVIPQSIKNAHPCDSSQR